MLQILGRNNSSNVQKVLWLCEELRIAYERHDYGGPFDNTTDARYLSLNPNARVPTIIDDEVTTGVQEDGHTHLVLWESNAILRHLCHKQIVKDGSCALYPVGPSDRAPVEQWLDWQQTTMGPAITPVFWGLIRTPESERDTGAIEKGHQATEAALKILNDTLTNQQYVAGDALTLADIPLGIMVYRWYEMPIERQPLAEVERWYDQLTKRAAFKKTVMIGLT